MYPFIPTNDVPSLAPSASLTSVLDTGVLSFKLSMVRLTSLDTAHSSTTLDCLSSFTCPFATSECTTATSLLLSFIRARALVTTFTFSVYDCSNDKSDNLNWRVIQNISCSNCYHCLLYPNFVHFDPNFDSQMKFPGYLTSKLLYFQRFVQNCKFICKMCSIAHCFR